MKRMKSDLRKIPTWGKVEKVLAVVGWELVGRDRNRFVFHRGSEQIISFRTVGGMRKSEYFVRNKLQDSTGVNNAEFTKLSTMELGVLK